MRLSSSNTASRLGWKSPVKHQTACQSLKGGPASPRRRRFRQRSAHSSETRRPAPWRSRSRRLSRSVASAASILATSSYGHIPFRQSVLVGLARRAGQSSMICASLLVDLDNITVLMECCVHVHVIPPVGGEKVALRGLSGRRIYRKPPTAMLSDGTWRLRL